VENIPHGKVREHFMKADIVVDQLVLGFYGTFACETMALQKPVCCYLRHDLLKYVPGCPLVNASAESVEDKLRELIESPKKMKSLGGKGPSFVRKIHDSAKIAKSTIRDYEKIL